MYRYLLTLLVLLMPLCVMGQSTEHIVKRGESISSISGLYGIDEKELIDANPRLNEFCVVGMKLLIPTSLTADDIRHEQKNEDRLSQLWEQGDLAFNNKDYKNASKSYSAALKIKHNDPLLHYNLGLCYFNRDKYKKAVEELDDCLFYSQDAEISGKAKALQKIAYERIEEQRENRRDFWSTIGLVAAGTALVVGSAAVAANSNQPSYQSIPSYSSSGRISDATLDQIDAYTRQEIIRNQNQFYQYSALNYAIRSQENARKQKEISWKLDQNNPVNALYLTFWEEWDKDPGQNGMTLFSKLVLKKYGRSPTPEELQFFQESFANGLAYRAGVSSDNTPNDDNSISVTQPSAGTRILCPRCKGKGRIPYDTNPPTFGLEDHKVKCEECGEYYLKSWGHSHIDCPQCHGHKYID